MEEVTVNQTENHYALQYVQKLGQTLGQKGHLCKFGMCEVWVRVPPEVQLFFFKKKLLRVCVVLCCFLSECLEYSCTCTCTCM